MLEIDDATYKSWQETCVRCTDEKVVVTNALMQIINKLPNRNALLDIGAGDGNLTLRLSPNFNATTAIEPNTEVSKIFTSHGVEFICDTFLGADLGLRKFDFIVCSHVFWLVKKEQRQAFVEKMLSLLAPGGRAAIVMGAPRGQCHELHAKFFLGYDMSSYDIVSQIIALGYDTTVVPVSACIKTESFDDFFSICKLFVAQSWLHPMNSRDQAVVGRLGDLEAYTKKKFAEIAAYIKTSCFREGAYQMINELDVIVLP